MILNGGLDFSVHGSAKKVWLKAFHNVPKDSKPFINYVPNNIEASN